MSKVFSLRENGLYISFTVYDNGVVELTHFMPETVYQRNKERYETRDDTPSDRTFPERKSGVPPILEVQITGKTTREMHGYKHNASSASHDLVYVRHEVIGKEVGKELIIYLSSEYGLKAEYHMHLFAGVPAVRVYSVLKNEGAEALPVEYVSSFIYQNLCGDGEKGYYEKGEAYIPRNSWSSEARWEKRGLDQLNLTGMPVDGFNTPGFGNNRFAYTGFSSWSSVEYLPMGLARDTEMNETYLFQIENSGQWHIEYDTEPGGKLALALSGPAEQEHGWWKDLRPGDVFETVPACFGVVEGGVDEALGALTGYRRAIRRPNEDDRKLNVVFNDYMNCLMGDPTQEKDMAIMDKAAEMGCEYFCLDCGWYDKDFWWDRVGEWMESKERFPDGLKALCDYARSKGMVMGLWLEIEVMGTECPLALRLPDDWFVCRHGKRHIDNKRYLLDFRNPAVYDYCMKVVDRLVEEYGVGYFKVDYNVTMGRGSDLNTESEAGAMLEHYRALYRWYEEIFRRHPDLVIENCGSGALRMDYGMLRLLSLQSTSDQTDAFYNSYIGTSVVSAVTPEQAGMWVYPYEDDTEHVAYNMVNGLLLRPYMSGMVWKLSQKNLDLLAEGVSVYKAIRGDIREALPFFPLGLNTVRDQALAYGLKKGKKAYLEVLFPRTDEADIPLDSLGEIEEAQILYPSPESLSGCEYSIADGTLHVKMPQAGAARLFCFTLK